MANSDGISLGRGLCPDTDCIGLALQQIRRKRGPALPTYADGAFNWADGFGVKLTDARRARIDLYIIPAFALRVTRAMAVTNIRARRDNTMIR